MLLFKNGRLLVIETSLVVFAVFTSFGWILLKVSFIHPQHVVTLFALLLTINIVHRAYTINQIEREMEDKS